MLEKSRNAVFFQWFVCQVSRKVGLLKRRVRSHVVSGEIKNCTPLWRKAHFEAKMYKTRQFRSTFWSSDVENMYAAVAKTTLGSENVKKLTIRDHFEVQMSKNCMPLWRKAHLEVKMHKTWCVWTTFVRADVEKMHAAVAKGTFGSQNLQNMTCLDHFWTCWCWKNARGCGERHIWKWKCWKTVVFGALLDVLMSNNCTPLWRKAHLAVKMLKNCSLRSTFCSSDVEKLVR